jgi:L-ascorbate metabolism protein UlaG (beta-lactamase superfamily)
MVDIGVPYRDIEKELYNIKYLLITHAHSDHINRTTLESLKKHFPRITIISNYEVHQLHRVHKISADNIPIKFKDYSFTPFQCEHDVICQGYVWQHKGSNIIYATDTSTLKHAPKLKYDWLFLESNHDEKKLEQVRSERAGAYSPYLSAKRHLSTQESKKFYYLNRKDRDSQWIELHKSSRFY